MIKPGEYNATIKEVKSDGNFVFAVNIGNGKTALFESKMKPIKRNG